MASYLAGDDDDEEDSTTSRTILAEACSRGDYEFAKELMASGSDPVTSRSGYFNWAPLHYTAKQGKLDFAQILITQYNCHPMVEDKEGCTPLHVACQHGQLEYSRYLIKQKRCDVHYGDVEDLIPLYHACGWLSECTDEQALTMSKFLISSAKCDPYTRDINGKSGVLHASEKGFVSVLKYFIEECHCDVSVVDYRENNLLHLAVSFSNNFEVVKYPLHHWLSFVSRVAKGRSKPNVIVVGSHSDIVKSEIKFHDTRSPRDKLKQLSLGSDSSDYEFVTKLLLDCQKSESSGMNMLRKHLTTQCELIRGNGELPFLTSCLLAFIKRGYDSTSMVSLQTLISAVESYVIEGRVVYDLRYFISEDAHILVPLLEDLDKSGYLLFMKNEADLKRSLIIPDVAQLCSELAESISSSGKSNAVKKQSPQPIHCIKHRSLFLGSGSP